MPYNDLCRPLQTLFSHYNSTQLTNHTSGTKRRALKNNNFLPLQNNTRRIVAFNGIRFAKSYNFWKKREKKQLSNKKRETRNKKIHRGYSCTLILLLPFLFSCPGNKTWQFVLFLLCLPLVLKLLTLTLIISHSCKRRGDRHILTLELIISHSCKRRGDRHILTLELIISLVICSLFPVVVCKACFPVSLLLFPNKKIKGGK